MLFSGREDFKTTDLVGFILLDEQRSQLSMLGTISQEEISEVATKEGLDIVRYIPVNGAFTADIKLNRLNVVYDDNQKITQVWVG